jgi:hypothetical protein
MRKSTYLNAVLTAAVVLLALNLVATLSESRWPATASAQPRGEPVVSPPFNSGEDRKVLIAQLESANQRLAAIEARLDKGFNVVVTKMPPVTIAERKDAEKRDSIKPESKIEVRRGGGDDAAK